MSSRSIVRPSGVTARVELFGAHARRFTGAYRYKPGLAQMAGQRHLFHDERAKWPCVCSASSFCALVESGEIHALGSDRNRRRINVRIVAATNRT